MTSFPDKSHFAKNDWTARRNVGAPYGVADIHRAVLRQIRNVPGDFREEPVFKFPVSLFYKLVIIVRVRRLRFYFKNIRPVFQGYLPRKRPACFRALKNTLSGFSIPFSALQ